MYDSILLAYYIINFVNCGYIYTHTRFDILTIKFSGINYIHSVVQPSPISILNIFVWPHTETLYPLNSNHIPPCPDLGNFSSTFCVYEYAYSRYLI